MNFVIFDDEKRSNFLPITLTRSTGDLRVGILKLRQRILSYLELLETNIIVSSELEAIYKERHTDWKVNEILKEETIFINSRIKIDSKTKKVILNLQKDECLIKSETILAARCTPNNRKITSENLNSLFSNLKKNNNPDINYWEFLWELIAENAEYIKRDFRDVFYDKDNYFESELGTTVINPYNVWIGNGTVMKPGVVIDATDGPVVLDENVTIMSNAVIIGPVYVGKGSTIKVGAKIYEGTSIGPVCKIGGEVEETIFQGYTNKQHDGFLGHSYLGEWINLGADTNNSDLKNNYKTVSIYFYPQNKKIDSKNHFLGVIIGDHSKTGINSTINTGTVIGIGCSLFGADLIKNHIPSFNIGSGAKTVEYFLEEFIETAIFVKKRRGLKFSESEKELYSKIYKQVF
jgi:UDP-N-acetylglucosamine diphosphorylase / glucose-1-phosphate thymidylyltransferase / UDP-N-acetylgalactosamine diphosphorylase / glucosamine-1-phosphate N-acetyltransferase / galactosamine-1-phosphate N-acetyltransferase